MIDPATGNPFFSQIPTGWEAYLPILSGMARGALTIAGGAGFTYAQTVSASQIEMAVSAAMAAAGLLWSGWQKIKAVRALRVAAQQPAGLKPPALPS